MKRYQMGVLGAGHMGLAIAEGAVAAGIYTHDQILLYNHTPEKRKKHAAEGYAIAQTPEQVYCNSEMMILAVRPQEIDSVLQQLAVADAAQKPLVVSVAAGVKFRKMEEKLGADCPIIRVMPNTPLTCGNGASALVRNRTATQEQLAQAVALFDKMGVTAVLEQEDMLNEVIPYNGSLPAYVYAFIHAMEKSAQEHQIPLDQARKLICETVIGSAKLVLQSGKSPLELCDAVCSPNGTTIEAIDFLRSHGFDQMLAQASDRCIARAYELGK